MAASGDQQLIEAIRQGNRAGVESVYRSMMPSLLRLVRHNGGREDDAKDLFQDAIVLIYKKIQSPDFQLTSSFSTFFYGVSRNLWANRLKKKSFGHVTLSDEPTYSFDSGDDWHELEEQTMRTRVFYRAFQQLGEDCRRLLQLFFQQKSMEEIMREMDLGSYDYVRRRKYLCKNKLTELMQNDPVYRELTGFNQDETTQI